MLFLTPFYCRHFTLLGLYWQASPAKKFVPFRSRGAQYADGWTPPEGRSRRGSAGLKRKFRHDAFARKIRPDAA